MRWVTGFAVLLLVGCTAPPAPEHSAPVPQAPVVFPAGGAGYQLGGAYPPPDGVTVVVRDQTESPAGLYSICYINGFQTQPGAAWPESLLLHDDGGDLLVDPDWPDEHLIDTRQPAAADELFDAIDSCAAKGFDAVEFDNLDSYTRSQGQLTMDDALAFARLLVQRAHAAGLAAGQKNTVELGARGRDEVGFDFAVVEECDQYEECGAMTGAYGAAVIDIEYTDELRRPFDLVCSDPATPPLTILRDRELGAPGSAGYTYERCYPRGS